MTPLTFRQCDGQRPFCKPCITRGLQHECHFDADPDAPPIIALKRKYEHLQRSNGDVNELFRMIKQRPESEAAEIFRRVRMNEDLGSLLTDIKGGDMLIQTGLMDINPHRNMQNQPQQQQLIQPWEESILRHPNAYPVLAPFEIPASASRNSPAGFRQFPQSARRKSQSQTPHRETPHRQYSTESSASISSMSSSLASAQDVSSSPSPSFSMGFTTNSPDFREDRSRQTLCDQRLHYAKAANWTNASIDDQAFRSMISMYLSWAHPGCRVFDEELFIEDLVANRQDFCSRMLVAAACATACLTYGSLDSSTSDLGRSFFDDAKSMWDQSERTGVPRSLTDVSTAYVLSNAAHLLGKSKLGTDFQANATRSAKHLGLFRTQTADQVYDVRYPKLRKARAVVAWGAYCMSACAFFYMHEETELRTPPPVPIPYDAEADENIRWDPHPLSRPLMPLHQEAVFKAVCELWMIGSDIATLYHAQDAPSPDKTKDKVNAIRERLFAWTDALPYPLTRTPSALPHVLMMHIYFHTIIVELHRPFTNFTIKQSEDMLDPPDKYPEQLTTASVQQLERILYQYRTQYGGARSLYMEAALLCVAFATLPHLEVSEARFFFNLSIKMLSEMVQAFPVIIYVLEAVNSAMNARGDQLPSEVQATVEEMQKIVSDHEHASEGDNTVMEHHGGVDLSLAPGDLEAVKMENLLQGTHDIDIRDRD